MSYSTNTSQVMSGQNLFLLAGLAALAALATNIILPAFAYISSELGVDPRRAGLTLSSFFLAYSVGQLVVGPLADRFGRKPVVIGGLALFIGGSLLCACAPTFSWLIAGRVVQAVGASAAFVLSRAIARDLYNGEALSRALALIMVAMSAAPGFSPLVGTLLGELLGWRFIFVGVGLFAVVLGWVYVRRMGETTPPSSITQPLEIKTIAIGYGQLLCDTRFIYPTIVVSLTIGALYTFFAAAPVVLVNEFGLSQLQFGIYFAATVFVVFGAGYLAPRLAHRWGAIQTVLLGAVLALAGNLLALNSATNPDLVAITTGLVLFLFGMGLVNPLGTALALQPFKNQAGLASGLQGFLQMGCAAVCSFIASTLPLPQTLSLAVTMTATSSLALLMVFIIMLQRNKHKVANAAC